MGAVRSHSRLYGSALLGLVLSALLSCPAAAATSRQPDVGVRAIAMGGAYVAVGGDAAALNWNPAAIASLQRQEVAAAYADRFGLGLGESYLSYVLPVSDNHALGLDWFHRGFDDVAGGLGLQSSQNSFRFAYGYRNGIRQLRPFIGNTAVGLSGKYLSRNAELDGKSVMSASGVGVDAGLLAPLPYGIRLGLVVQDVGGTSVEHDSGLNEKVLDSRWRLGLAHKPIEGLTVALDLDDHARVGAEYWLRGQLALRAGLKTELDTPETRSDATSTSVGLGLKYRFMRLDYAYERHPVLDATHYTSVSLAYNPKVITIKSATIRPDPLFRSLYPHYQEIDFLDVVIANSAPEPIEASVALMIPKVMSVPHQEQVLLPPQSTEKYTFKVTFDPDLFNQPDAYYDHFVSSAVTLSYTRDRRPQTVDHQLERVYVAGKGKLSWNVPGMAAAFVTPSDLAVSGLARGLIQRYDDLLTGKFNRSNLGKAALLFDALGVYRISYQADQKTPFASISDDRTIFDTVQYPSELLQKEEGETTKIGDCDDLTVLFASLLENLSIDTAFLEANDPGKGHIYLMFDSGVPPDRSEDHFTSPSEYVEWQGRIWIPVETTMYGFTFGDAWRTGVAEYKRLKLRDQINEVYVQKWVQTYKAPVLPAVVAVLPRVEALDSLLTRDIAFFEHRTDQIAMGSGTSLDTPDGAYEAGSAYLRANHLDKAREMFAHALSMDPRHTDAMNAIGVVLTKRGRYDAAIEQFRQALAVRDENGVRMNLALTYYLKGERETADRMFEQVVALDEGYGELFEFMSTVGDAQEYYDIGVSYLRQSRLDQALEQFDLALGSDPKFAEAIGAQGVIACHRGQYDKALALFQQASELVPTQLGFQMNIALAYHLRGEHQKAEVLYQQVTAQDAAYEGLFDFLSATESATESYRLAVGYLHQGELDKALERLDDALRADPTMADALNSKGVILTRLADYSAAYEAFEQAENLMPGNPGVHLNMAIVRYLQGRRHEAAVIYRQAVDMDPRYEGFLDFLAEGE